MDSAETKQAVRAIINLAAPLSPEIVGESLGAVIVEHLATHDKGRMFACDYFDLAGQLEPFAVAVARGGLVKPLLAAMSSMAAGHEPARRLSETLTPSAN